jgi:hypothetical protein
MPSIEQLVRAHLDAARGLSDAALKLHTGHGDELNVVDGVVACLAIGKALMDCTVDLAAAIDRLASHTGCDLSATAE